MGVSKPKGNRQFICIFCNKEFTASHKRKYCSMTCSNRQAAERSGAQPKREWIHATCKECGSEFNRHHPADASCEQCRAKRRAGSDAVCAHCGIAYTVPFRQSTARKYCSYACMHEAQVKEVPQFSRVRFAKCRWCDVIMHPSQLSGATCSNECAVMMTRVAAWASDRGLRPTSVDATEQYRKTLGTRRCKECDTEYMPTRSGRGYCSYTCSERNSKRITKATRRAKASYTLSVFYKHPVLNRVDPIYILRRDGWKCYICGRETPMRLRGSIEPNAPEVDHIMPLSKGGEHAEYNLACSCRECNQAKSDKIICEPIDRPHPGRAEASILL